MRESPALDIIHLLQRRGATVTYSDPHVPTVRIENETLFSMDPAEGLEKSDCAVIITDHTSLDYRALVDKAALIVDTRNALRGLTSDKIIRL